MNDIEIEILDMVTEEDFVNGIIDKSEVLYSRDGRLLLRCRNDRLKQYIIKDGTEIIYNCAFEEEYDGEHLQRIVIPDSVTTIADSAFHGCIHLHQISIPDSVTHIGSWAFGKCIMLPRITLPASLKYIGDNPFSGNDYVRLTSNSSRFVVQDGFLIDNEENRLIAYLRHEESVNIPQNIKVIGNSAFWGCKSLCHITIPDSVTSIGFRAFFGLRLVAANCHS